MFWLLLLLCAASCLYVVRGLWTECSLEDVIDTESMPLLGDFWNGFVRNSSNLHIDSGTSLDQGRFFMRWAYILTGDDEMTQVVVQNCLFGVLTLLLQALPAVDYEKGRPEALSLMEMARSLLAQASEMEGFMDVVAEAETQGWEVRPLLLALELYRAYLPEPQSPPEECEGPRFFVYPPPEGSPQSASQAGGAVSSKELLFAGPGHYLDAVAHGPLQCLFGMYGTEYLFHHFFRSLACTVQDPSDADFFFVPSYFKCIEVLNYVEKFDADETEASVLLRQTVDYVDGFGPWFRRHDGADHIFLYSWGRFPCRLHDWRLQTRSAIALQVEDQCEDLNSEGPQPTFSRWKDVIIPGHIDQWRVAELTKHNLPFRDRDILIAFHGRHAGNTESYARVDVRTQILEELEGLPGVSVGGFIEGYHELLGQSIFCLAPRGITPWTIHLYVALMAGCVPVILSDDYEVPFQGIVDWPSFSIKWPMNASGRKLYSYLSSLDPILMHEMKKKVDENSCWFNYYSSGSCSPYRAVLRSLEERLRGRPPFAGRWWGPGGRPLPARGDEAAPAEL